MTRRRIGVVGGCVSGLTAAYVLSATDDVTLFEAARRLGGHAHTHQVGQPDGSDIWVDSGPRVRASWNYALPSCAASSSQVEVSYRGWGFHEDGCRAGLAARSLGGRW